MRFMILIKADKNSEAGVMSSKQLLANMEAAKFPAQLAHGWALPITALFATSDIAAGNELRWNYRQFGVKPLIR